MVSIIVAQPVGGKREFKFESGAKLAQWVWKNKINMFTDLKKNE